MGKYLLFSIIFCILGCLIASGNHAFKIGSLREGEVCYYKNKTASSDVYVCKQKKDCSIMQGRYINTLHSSEPDLSAACAAPIGSEPMVCCRGVTKPENNTMKQKVAVMSNSYYNSASKMCEFYSNLHYKQPENCEESFQTRQGKVFGGNKTKPAEFPHMAYIQCKGPEKGWSCGGSLISNKWILSAGHCAPTANDVRCWATLGHTNVDITKLGKNNYRSVADVVVHPSYDNIRILNDVALFRLAEAVEFSTFVRPICLNTNPKLKFQKATVIGWGLYEKNNKHGSFDLLKGEVNYVSNEDCNLSFDSVDKYSTVCAKGSLDSGIGVTCQGDSGGPLQVRNANYPNMFTEVGLTSFGRENCGGGTPVVFTRVSYYVDWIASIVWPKY